MSFSKRSTCHVALILAVTLWTPWVCSAEDDPYALEMPDEIHYFITTLQLATPIGHLEGVDKVIYRWSSFESTGRIGSLELIDLSMELVSGNTLVYHDPVLINGMFQPAGGVQREEDDLFWDFDLDTRTLYQMRNVGYFTVPHTSGVVYLVDDNLTLLHDNRVYFQRYTDGYRDLYATNALESQTTISVIVFHDGFEAGNTSAWSSTSNQ